MQRKSKYTLKAWLISGGFVAGLVGSMMAISALMGAALPAPSSVLDISGNMGAGYLLAVCVIISVIFASALPWAIWATVLAVLLAIGIAYPVAGVLMLAIGVLMLVSK